MGYIALVPGVSNEYISLAMTTLGATNYLLDGPAALDLDLSMCTQVTIEVFASLAVGGTFQLMQTFDGTNYAELGSGIAAANATIVQLSPNGIGQFGRIEVDCSNVTGVDSTNTLTLTFRGQRLASGL